MEGCGGSCISHYVDNKYPGRAQNRGRWITLAVMTITPPERGSLRAVVVVGVWRCDEGGVRKKAGSHD